MNSNKLSPAEHRYSPAYMRYALGILFLVNMVNMLDRAVLNVLLEQIRIDLELSDTQIGILTGFAFALFYAFAGIFLARLSDIYNRPRLMTAAISIWSVISSLTGLANNFVQFFTARMFVGVSESSAVPTSLAMIADYYPPSKRSLPFGVFTIGSFAGIIIGSAIGGYVGAHYGWRWAFLAAGLFGLPLALLVAFTLKDPPRGWSDGTHQDDHGSVDSAPTLVQTLRALFGNPAFVTLIVAAGLITYLAYGVSVWLPAFLIRTHGMDQVSVGFAFGLTLSIGSASGSILGGMLANTLAKRSLNWLIRTPLFLSLLFLPLYELAVYATDATTALIFIGLAFAVGGATLAPVLAAIQTVVPATMRATASGLVGFSGNLIGMGGAPFIIGLLSDHFSTSLGPAEALQRALGIAVFAAIPATIVLFAADRAYTRISARKPDPVHSTNPGLT